MSALCKKHYSHTLVYCLSKLDFAHSRFLLCECRISSKPLTALIFGVLLCMVHSVRRYRRHNRTNTLYYTHYHSTPSRTTAQLDYSVLGDFGKKCSQKLSRKSRQNFRRFISAGRPYRRRQSQRFGKVYDNWVDQDRLWNGFQIEVSSRRHL